TARSWSPLPSLWSTRSPLPDARSAPLLRLVPLPASRPSCRTSCSCKSPRTSRHARSASWPSRRDGTGTRAGIRGWCPRWRALIPISAATTGTGWRSSSRTGCPSGGPTFPSLGPWIPTATTGPGF
ncbi:hypothetical protein DFJ74DRAFT_769651, partial [Hyaloraphidium curvatum]